MYAQAKARVSLSFGTIRRFDPLTHILHERSAHSRLAQSSEWAAVGENVFDHDDNDDVDDAIDKEVVAADGEK